MDNHLIITAIGENTTGLIEQLTRIVKECNCTIGESRISVMGREMCLLLLVSGSWNAIVKIEDILKRREKQLALTLETRRTAPAIQDKKMMPYAIDVVAIDRAGIVHNIVNFFNENKIGIHEISTNTYRTNNTGATMFSMHMTINIPSDISIASVRGDFMDFCDQLNLDAIMEPVK